MGGDSWSAYEGEILSTDTIENKVQQKKHSPETRRGKM